MFEQLVNNKDCSSIQFLLRAFYQGYQKDLSFIKLFGARQFHIPKYKNFDGGEMGRGDVFLVFWVWSQKVVRIHPYTTTY